METYDLVKAALKEKNPALFKELASSGELHQFVTERADEIQDEIATLTMELSNKARMALKGQVATSAPTSAHWMMCMGCRMLAAKIPVSSP